VPQRELPGWVSRRRARASATRTPDAAENPATNIAKTAKKPLATIAKARAKKPLATIKKHAAAKTVQRPSPRGARATSARRGKR